MSLKDTIHRQLNPVQEFLNKYYGDSTGTVNILGVHTFGHFKTNSSYAIELAEDRGR
jgi:hypothetical protein